MSLKKAIMYASDLHTPAYMYKSSCVCYQIQEVLVQRVFSSVQRNSTFIFALNSQRSRRKSSENASNADQSSTVSLCNLVSPCSHEAKEVKNWSVEQVCRFVSTVEHCQPFVEVSEFSDLIFLVPKVLNLVCLKKIGGI